MTNSGIYTSFRLDPFFQIFLRNYFERDDSPVFYFPKGHDLLRRLETVLRPSPPDYKTPKKTDWLFLVELPYMKHKDPLTYNYISSHAGTVMAYQVRRFFNMVFSEKMMEFRNAGFEYKECVSLFQDLYGLPFDSTDRLEKNFQRWRINLRVQNHRKEKILSSRKNSQKKYEKTPG